MKSQPSVLFVGHDASRSGAPLVLLGLLRWLHQNTNWHIKLLLLKHGELEKCYREVAEVTLYQQSKPRSIDLWNRVSFRMGLSSQFLLRPPLTRIYRAGDIDLIHVNTVASAARLPELMYLNVPAILHVHESEMGLAHYVGARWTELTGSVSRFIGCSWTTARCLIDQYHVAPDKVDVVPEPLLPFAAKQVSPRLQSAAEIRARLGIPPNSLVVGGCGTHYWRKGMDLFAQVCELTQRQHADHLHCVWIGGSERSFDGQRFTYDMSKRGMGRQFHWVPDCTDPLSYMQLFDVFCMTSRDEAFGMVNVEAGYLKKPVVYFNDVGGPTEIVRDDAGIGVPYGDVSAMADAVESLLRRPEQRELYGRVGHLRAMDKYAPDKVFSQMRDVLADVMALGRDV